MKFYKFGNKATSSVSSPASEHVQSAHIFCKVRDESMKLDKVAHFVLDECDQCLEKLDMRGDIQKIFLATPKKKQVMMSACVHLLSSHRHTSRRAAACGRAQLLANGDMEHGFEIENVGPRSPLSTAVTWPLADGLTVYFDFYFLSTLGGKILAKFGENLAIFGQT